MRGIAILKGNDKIFQKKLFFFSLKLTKKKKTKKNKSDHPNVWLATHKRPWGGAATLSACYRWLATHLIFLFYDFFFTHLDSYRVAAPPLEGLALAL